jgi:hypothetical protein
MRLTSHHYPVPRLRMIGAVPFFFSMARQPYMGLGLLVSSWFQGHTHFRHTTVGRTPLDEWSARRRDLYLTTHNTHKKQTSMPPVGFEPAIPASERLQTHALDRMATGIGWSCTLTTPICLYGMYRGNFTIIEHLQTQESASLLSICIDWLSGYWMQVFEL